MIHWLFTAASLVGVILNIHRQRACFYIWAVTNAWWCAVDWSHGLYAQSTLMSVYFTLAVYGAWSWRKQPT
jgi:nicotinamide riboside transporter PnuC